MDCAVERTAPSRSLSPVVTAAAATAAAAAASHGSSKVERRRPGREWRSRNSATKRLGRARRSRNNVARWPGRARLSLCSRPPARSADCTEWRRPGRAQPSCGVHSCMQPYRAAAAWQGEVLTQWRSAAPWQGVALCKASHANSAARLQPRRCAAARVYLPGRVHAHTAWRPNPAREHAGGWPRPARHAPAPVV